MKIQEKNLKKKFFFGGGEVGSGRVGGGEGGCERRSEAFVKIHFLGGGGLGLGGGGGSGWM